MQLEGAEVEKRFEAIDNDYLSIPDTDDFSFSKGYLFLYIRYEGPNRATVKVMKDMKEFGEEIDKAFSTPYSILAGSHG